MKHYMDIANLREKEERVGDIVVPSNTSAFELCDLIQITEKFDGSNASIEKVDGVITAFSRKNELSPILTLNGFFNFVQNLVLNGLDIPEGIVVFGEWSGARNKLVYEKKNSWLVFDVFDKNTGCYWKQEDVEAFCISHGLEYIHELYFGPFISWEHCKSFLHSPAYGDRQEGVVVKNQDKLKEANDYFYLKIVNDDFKEKIKVPKTVDPAKQAEKDNAKALMESIITRPRVEKMLFKLRDEGVIPSVLTVNDMSLLARNLPPRIYEDCLKEEKETVMAAGEYAGKMCSSLTMSIVRDIVQVPGWKPTVLTVGPRPD